MWAKAVTGRTSWMMRDLDDEVDALGGIVTSRVHSQAQCPLRALVYTANQEILRIIRDYGFVLLSLRTE